jgi:hypothetical protein
MELDVASFILGYWLIWKKNKKAFFLFSIIKFLDSEEPFKVAIAVCRDLGMTSGKIAAQVCPELLHVLRKLNECLRGLTWRYQSTVWTYGDWDGPRSDKEAPWKSRTVGKRRLPRRYRLGQRQRRLAFDVDLEIFVWFNGTDLFYPSFHIFSVCLFMMLI